MYPPCINAIGQKWAFTCLSRVPSYLDFSLPFLCFLLLTWLGLVIGSCLTVVCWIALLAWVWLGLYPV